MGELEVPPSSCNLSGCPHLADIGFLEVEGSVKVILGAAHIIAWHPLDIRHGGNGENIVGIKIYPLYPFNSHESHVARTNTKVNENQKQKSKTKYRCKVTNGASEKRNSPQFS